MKCLLVWITVLAYVGATPPPLLEENCGDPANMGNRIAGGKDAMELGNPWMAMVLAAKPLGFLCGGSLITPWFVLTAAHYLSDEKQYIVRLGEYNRDIYDDEAVDYDVIKSFTHAYFNKDTHENDIAMLLLERRVVYTDYIQPICVVLDPGQKQAVDAASSLRAVGWGETGPNNKTSRILQTLTMKRTHEQDCALKYNRTLSPSQICVTGRAPNSQMCNGDSGGPVVGEIENPLEGGSTKFVQIGIISYSDLMCEHTNIVTDVNSHGDWIYKVAMKYTPTEI
ncbi:mast cell protease 1A-like [Drosophila bipectinata]|uniref:mast cell protease 1A-like n=1 Tax=Drosophila bipectinata TaxID=42026 RepID=UPI0038B3E74C